MSIALYQDPFSPVLTSSEPLVLSDEQRHYIKEILDICCADSQFADKAYRAIRHILTGGSVVVPVINSLSPGSATIGEPAFDMHVIGTGFTVDSKIVFNGYDEPTTFNSPTDVSTGINMPLWLAPAVVPVVVVSGDGVPSNPVNFVFQDAGSPVVLSAPKPVKGTK